MDIDIALRILAHAVGIAVFDIGGEFTPIVDALVFVIAAADDRFGGPGFVRGSQNERRRRSGYTATNHAKKTATRIRHIPLLLDRLQARLINSMAYRHRIQPADTFLRYFRRSRS